MMELKFTCCESKKIDLSKWHFGYGQICELVTQEVEDHLATIFSGDGADAIAQLSLGPPLEPNDIWVSIGICIEEFCAYAVGGERLSVLIQDAAYDLDEDERLVFAQRLIEIAEKLKNHHE